MGVVLSLSPDELSVEPGREAKCELKLRNTGSVVDQFSLELVGDVTDWAVIEPPLVNLFPDAEGTAQLVFKPPKSSDVLAGEQPFAVKAVSREDGEGSVVEEGTVTVGVFAKIGAEFVPHGSRGSFRARHRLAIDNLGNAPMPVGIGVTAPDNELIFKIRRSALTVAPGTATLVPVRVIPKKRFFKGPKKTHPFQAAVTGEGVDPVTADAAMVQEQIFPTWLPAVLGALFALLVTVVILWFSLLKPVLKTQAQTAASQAASQQAQSLASGVQQAQSQAQSAAQNAQSANQQAQSANSQASKALVVAGGGTPAGAGTSPSASAGAGGTGQQGAGGSSASTSPGLSPGPTSNAGGGSTSGASSGASPASTPMDLTIQANAPAGQAGTFKTFSFTVPTGKTFLITDFVISNPNGDSGTLEIRRGTATLIPLGLDNFRSYDQHFVQPIVIPSGQQLVLAVDCHNTTAACTPSGYFSGQLQ